MRRAAKVDQNQSAIVKALREIPGVTVAVGHDDILVGFRGRTLWFEVKRPESKKRLQESQKKLKAEWAGHYRVVWTIDQIIEEIGVGATSLDVR